MERVFFLAANSCRGFASLYDGFPCSGTFLHIIKGGPGTGKSGFMRRIKEAAESREMDTETILCSGDPDSLDGLYIPALGQAWMDGTAPHVREPSVFGVDSDYVNLGAFCRLPLSAADRERAADLNRAYKAEYAAAYRFLAAAGEAERAYQMPEDGKEDRARVNGIFEALPKKSEAYGRTEERFISTISGKGTICLDKTVNLLCKQKYFLNSAESLSYARRLAEEKGQSVIVCPEPLNPEKLEAVLLPECSVCLALADRKARRTGGGGTRIRQKLLHGAVGELARAKALHDELEMIYRPYMDFEALTEYTERYIRRLFANEKTFS